MRKSDEIALYAAVRESRGTGAIVPVWPDLSGFLGIHENRAQSILLKWDSKGWWEYGVSARMGWFTNDAPAALEP